jgi:hypothetical protein
MRGTIVTGCGDFTRRMTKYPEPFREVTGQELYPGTLNVDVGRAVAIKEDGRIVGAEINEAEDILLEKCKINGIPAWRMRPRHPKNGTGGWGDHILEISCSQKIPNMFPGTVVEITFFRDGTDTPDRKD